MSDNASSRYVMTQQALIAACVLSAAGALVFNAFPLFLSTIADQWKLSDEQLGLLGSTYLGGFALISLGAVFWMPRLKWKATGLVAYLLIGAGVIGFSLTGKTTAVFASMALLGVGSGTIFTLALGVLSRATNPDRAYGLKISTEMIAASILVYAMTSLVIKHFGFQGFAYGTIILYGLSALSIMLLPQNFMKTEDDAFESHELQAQSDGAINPAGWLSAIALFIQFAAFSALLQICVVYQMALVTVADETGKFTVMMAFILSFGGAVGPGVAGFLKTEASYLPVYIAVCIVTVVSLLLTFQVSRMLRQKA